MVQAQALGVVWDDVNHQQDQQTEISTPISVPSHFGARVLLDYWEDRKSKGGLVVGKDVPSRKVASILRNLMVYEPVDGGKDFLVRLCGAVALRRFGRDVTGERLSSLFPNETFERRREAVNAAIRDGQPIVRDVRVLSDGRPELRFEYVAVPVHSPDKSATWLLGGIFYHDWSH